MIVVTPTTTGLSATEVKALKLPQDIESEPSEMVTKIFQQEADPKPKVVQEIHPKPIVLLPKHLDPKFEQPEVVPIPKDDRLDYPQMFVIVETSPLSQSQTPKIDYGPDGEILPLGLIAIEEEFEKETSASTLR